MKKGNKKKKAVLFAAYLAVAVPVNSAMAADWKPVNQTPVAAAQVQSSITEMPDRYFKITAEDVGQEVVRQMQAQGFKQKVNAIVTPAANQVIYAADHPLKLAVHALQVDSNAQLWQAQAYIISGSTTESVKPVSGRYEAMVTVPVLKRQLRQGDVIEQGDIEMHEVTERQLRKDSITDVKQLVGLSPRRIISADRPIRLKEISQPIVIKKGQAVEMTYSTPYMRIRTTGIALEDGSAGDLIRVKNDKNDKALSARVAGAGHVEANNEAL